MLWAERVTRNSARASDDAYAELCRHFNQAEIVELTLMSAFFNMFNRFMDALRIPVEVQGEVDKIKRSLMLDPEKVRTYLGTVLENWPNQFPAPNEQSGRASE